MTVLVWHFYLTYSRLSRKAKPLEHTSDPLAAVLSSAMSLVRWARSAARHPSYNVDHYDIELC